MSDDKMDAVTALRECFSALGWDDEQSYEHAVEIDGELTKRGYHLTPIAPPQGELRERWRKIGAEATASYFDTTVVDMTVNAILSDLAAQGLRVVPGWQSIETAPKDGTVVDLWMGNDEFPHRVTDAKWCKPQHKCVSKYCDSCPDDMNKFAWREAITGYDYKAGEPTHWMATTEPGSEP